MLALTMTGLGGVLAVYYWLLLTMAPDAGNPADFRWYFDSRPTYADPALGFANGYNYSPAFEFVMAPLRLLPFEVALGAWRAVQLALVVWMAGPFSVIVLLTMPVASEINAGNIQILLAAAIVAGFRWPAAWAFVLLTKVTPGVGLLWFALRREWRAFGVALLATVAIAAVSVALNPGAWLGWFALLGQPAQAPAPFFWGFWDRLPLALGCLIVGAWRGWRWMVPIAGTLTLPVFYTISPSMLVGALYLARASR